MLPPSSLRTRLVDEARALLPENAFDSSFCVRARKRSGTCLTNAHCNSDKSPSTTLSQLWKVLEEVRARYGKLRVQTVHIQIQIRYNGDYVSCSQDSKDIFLFIATQQSEKFLDQGTLTWRGADLWVQWCLHAISRDFDWVRVGHTFGSMRAWQPKCGFSETALLLAETFI